MSANMRIRYGECATVLPGERLWQLRKRLMVICGSEQSLACIALMGFERFLGIRRQVRTSLQRFTAYWSRATEHCGLALRMAPRLGKTAGSGVIPNSTDRALAHSLKTVKARYGPAV